MICIYTSKWLLPFHLHFIYRLTLFVVLLCLIHGEELAVAKPGLTIWGLSSRAALIFSSRTDKDAQHIYDESYMQRSRLILFNFSVFPH